MKSLLPYLYFDGDAQQAFDFYKSVFGGDFAGIMRYRDFGGAPGTPDEQLDRVAHIALPLGDGVLLMASDVMQPGTLEVGNNIDIVLGPDSAEEAQRVFDALAQGGKVNMALQKTEWAQLHGSCTDKFGIRWMFDFTGDVQFEAG